MDRTVIELDASALALGTVEGAMTSAEGGFSLRCAGSGAFESAAIDAGQAVVWEQVEWDAETPEGSGVTLRTRFASLAESLTSTPWSVPYTASGEQAQAVSSGVCATRYAQFRMELSARGGAVPSVGRLRIHFRLPQPTGFWPLDKSAVHPDDLELRWIPVRGAAKYQLQTAGDPEFARDIATFDGLKDHRFKPPAGVTPDSPPLYWRVRAASGTGKWSSWSSVKEVRFSHRRIGDEYSFGPHPRLFMDRAQLEILREKARSDQAVAECVRLIRKQADAALDLYVPTPQEADETEDLHLKLFDLWISLRNGEALEALALTFLLSGEERYARSARRIMLDLVVYERWTSRHFRDSNAFDPEWAATLETAAMTKGIAIAYDWLYDWLSEADRETIREGLVRVGVKPLIHDWCDPDTYWRIPAHQQPFGNWWGVCNGCAGIGALAVLGEEPEAHKWLRLAEDAVCSHVNYGGGDVINRNARADAGYEELYLTEPNFGIDFGYPESIGYIMYGLTHDLYLVEALERATGTDVSGCFDPDLLIEPLYGMYHDVDRGWGSLSFNDSGDGPVQADGSVLFAKHTGNRRFQWMFEQCQGAPNSIHSLLAYDGALKAQPPDDMPKIKLFRDIGWAIFRTGWGHTDSMFAAKFHQGRGHADLGQFVVHHKGRRQVMESGTVDYHSPVYQQFLAHTQAHNVLMIDDQQQNRRDGRITGFVAMEGAGLVAADLTSAYRETVGSWHRGLGFFDEGIYIVWDRVRADAPHKYSWLLHPEAGFRADSTRVEMGTEQAGLNCWVLSNAELQVETPPGYLSFAHVPEEHPYLSFDCHGSGDADFLAVFADGDFTAFNRLDKTSAEVVSSARRCFVSLGDCTGDEAVEDFRGTLIAAVGGEPGELPEKLIAFGCERIKLAGVSFSAPGPADLVAVRTGAVLRVRASAGIEMSADAGLQVIVER